MSKDEMTSLQALALFSVLTFAFGCLLSPQPGRADILSTACISLSKAKSFEAHV